MAVNRSILGKAVSPCRRLEAGIRAANGCPDHCGVERGPAPRLGMIDSGEAFASEVAPAFSVDADFLRGPALRRLKTIW